MITFNPLLTITEQRFENILDISILLCRCHLPGPWLLGGSVWSWRRGKTSRVRRVDWLRLVSFLFILRRLLAVDGLRRFVSSGEKEAEHLGVLELSGGEKVTVPGLGQLLGLLQGGELDSSGQDLAGVTGERADRSGEERGEGREVGLTGDW